MGIRNSKVGGGGGTGKAGRSGRGGSAAQDSAASAKGAPAQVRGAGAQGNGLQARVQRAGGQGAQVGAQIGAQVGSVVGSVVGQAGQRAVEAAGTFAQGYGTVRERVSASDPGALVRQWGEALEGVVEDGRARAGALATPPSRSRSRSWPWAVGASAAGAAAGVGLVLAARRLLGSDAPGAQEPEQLRAVVDPTPVAGPGRHTTVDAAGSAGTVRDVDPVVPRVQE